MGKVAYICGEPLNRVQTGARITGRSNSRSRRNTYRQSFIRGVEKWYYDVGGGVIHVLTFEGGIVKRIHYFRK